LLIDGGGGVTLDGGGEGRASRRDIGLDGAIALMAVVENVVAA